MARQTRKRQHGRKAVSTEDVAAWAHSRKFPEGARCRVNPEEVPRMSAVLIDFAQPFLQGDESVEIYRRVLTMAALAWNASFLPAAERNEARDEFANTVCRGSEPEDYAFALNLFEGMTRRRRDEFGEIRRMIVDVDVAEGAGGAPRVNVAASPIDVPDDERPSIEDTL